VLGVAKFPELNGGAPVVVLVTGKDELGNCGGKVCGVVWSTGLVEEKFVRFWGCHD